MTIFKDIIARFMFRWFIYPLEDLFEDWVLTEDERSNK